MPLHTKDILTRVQFSFKRKCFSLMNLHLLPKYFRRAGVHPKDINSFYYITRIWLKVCSPFLIAPFPSQSSTVTAINLRSVFLLKFTLDLYQQAIISTEKGKPRKRINIYPHSPKPESAWESKKIHTWGILHVQKFCSFLKHFCL